jgi:hypothetical protein
MIDIKTRTARSRARRLRVTAGTIVAGALAVTSLAAGTSSAHATAGGLQDAGGQTAAVCNPIFGLTLSSNPSLDMALGFANNTSANAPLSMRNSSGLSRAELWVEIPGPFGTVTLRNLNDDEDVFGAGVLSQSSGSAVVAERHSVSDSSQWWFKNSAPGGFVTYTNAFSNKRVTGVPGAQAPVNGKPWQQHFPGSGGDQSLRQVKVGCL